MRAVVAVTVVVVVAVAVAGTGGLGGMALGHDAHEEELAGVRGKELTGEMEGEPAGEGVGELGGEGEEGSQRLVQDKMDADHDRIQV